MGRARKRKRTARQGECKRKPESFCWRIEGNGILRGSGGVFTWHIRHTHTEPCRFCGGKGTSAVADWSSPSSSASHTHQSWQKGGKGSSAVEMWPSPSTSPSHTDQCWYEGVWEGGGESNETSYADQWEEVWDTSDPSWWCNNQIDKIEYNSTTGRYRYTTPCPWHIPYGFA